MRTGFPTGCPTGQTEEMLIGFVPVIVDSGAGALLPIRPAPGCGNRNWAYGADRKVLGIVYVAEGSTKPVRVPIDPVGSHSFFAECIGLWNDVGDVDVAEPTLEIETAVGGSIEVQFPVKSTLLGSVGDSRQLSNWTLAGVTRWATCRPRTFSKFEGELDVTLTLEGGVLFVRLYLGDALVAEGSRVGDGVIVLAEVDGSGVSGEVTVAYTADVTSGCVVIKRWCAYYDVKVSLETKRVLDPGMGEVLVVKFDGAGDLGAATQNVQIGGVNVTIGGDQVVITG